MQRLPFPKRWHGKGARYPDVLLQYGTSTSAKEWREAWVQVHADRKVKHQIGDRIPFPEGTHHNNR
ncbi:exosome complex exonuclease rrp45 [Anopheles sinensis]|uniref:Exosome complex exonuclease rrp45 n=1 Tax=Anopheles sinensis TaxID=74873 RepID=A0A084WGM1_ANOSI|nr:exosome complex exonuclease rrp45 [Anopheles sinensis]